MISDGSCDPKDGVMFAENPAFGITRINDVLKCMKIENN